MPKGPLIPLGELASTYKGWIIDRVGRCVMYLVEEFVVHKELIEGAMILRMAPVLLNLAAAHETVAASPEAQTKFRALAKSRLEKPLVDIYANDFSVLNEHCLVSMWASVEVCVEDTLTAILVNDDEARAAVERYVKRLAAPERPDLIAKNVKSWQETIRKPDKSTSPLPLGRVWHAMFQIVGVRLPDLSDIEEDLNEAKAIRNSIMHRHGVIDDQTVARAPTLAPTNGRRLQLSTAQFDHYHRVCSKFAKALQGSLANSRYAIVT